MLSEGVSFYCIVNRKSLTYFLSRELYYYVFITKVIYAIFC